MMARLVPVEGEPVEPVVWQSGRKSFGRDPACDVVLDHALVSRRHATVELRADGAWIADHGSKNGTRVNGRAVTTEAPLHHGDLVEIGAWKARFESGEAGVTGGATARFVLEEGAARSEHQRSVATIGRDWRSTVLLRDPRVSRLHATVHFLDGAFYLRDGGSTNGTFVGRERVVERRLASGDEIGIGAGQEQTQGEHRQPGDDLEPAARIRVAIEGNTCALTVEETSGLVPGVGETLGVASDATRPMPAFLAIGSLDVDPDENDEEAIVAPALRGKAKHRGPRWVPTADLAGHRLRRALVLLLGGSALTGGLWALGAEREDLIAGGPLSAVHDSAKFVAAAGGRPACVACHEPWQGVTDPGCVRCHAATGPAAGGHARLAVACASCHPEHRGRAPALEPIERHRCADCHAGAHAPVPEGAATGTASAKLFLNRSATAPRVHAGHRALACERCHATLADQESGRTTSTCVACHGGAGGVADSRCTSCHRFHEPSATRP